MPLSREAPRIVGVAPGDPWDRHTWSGASHHLFSALRRRNTLLGAVSAMPPPSLETAAKLAAIWPRRRRWVERYEFSRLRRLARSKAASRRVRRLAGEGPYATLQIGAWYSLEGAAPLLRASFHDANLALFARDYDFIEDSAASHVQLELTAERRLFDELDVIFTMSDWLRRSIIEDFGQDPAKVVTTGSGANVRQFPETIPSRPLSPIRLLFVGYDFERKGGPILLEAFATLRESEPDAELLIAGPPPGEPKPGVHWLGAVDRSTEEGDRQMDRLHREATAFVLGSRYEPFGNALVEAMSYGLPCVASSVCGLPEIVDGGRTGLLVPPGDAAALAAALLRLAVDPQWARAMGEAGFERVRERFTWDLVADKMIAEIAARTASPSGS